MAELNQANRNRSASYTGVPGKNSTSPELKRNHSVSVSSVGSDLDDIPDPQDFDLEKQIILTAGGRREYVCCFLVKLVFLCIVVSACGVMVFYAL